MSRQADKLDRVENYLDPARFKMSAKKARYLKWRTTRRERRQGKQEVDPQ